MRLVQFTIWNGFHEREDGPVWINPEGVRSVCPDAGFTQIVIGEGLWHNVLESVAEVVARLTADPVRDAELRAEYERLKAEKQRTWSHWRQLDHRLMQEEYSPTNEATLAQAAAERDKAYSALDAFVAAHPEYQQPATVGGERAEGGG